MSLLKEGLPIDSTPADDFARARGARLDNSRREGTSMQDTMKALRQGEIDRFKTLLRQICHYSDSDGLFQYNQGEWDSLLRICMVAPNINQKNRAEITGLILANSKRPEQQIAKAYSKDTSMLMHAINRGWADVAVNLIKYGADVNETCKCGKGHSVFVKTLTSGGMTGEQKAKVVEALVEKGADINSKFLTHDDFVKYLRASNSSALKELIPFASDKVLFDNRDGGYNKSNADRLIGSNYSAEIRQYIKERAENFMKETGFNPLNSEVEGGTTFTTCREIQKGVKKRVCYDFQTCTMSVITTVNSEKTMDVKHTDFIDLVEKTQIYSAASALTRLGGNPGESWKQYCNTAH